ncbi:MAG: ThiF family adenylyltransferase [Dehalococcoidales bacterium]|nr:ThiF family adenylyltransferase [Dehalococcoidales bacterium]
MYKIALSWDRKTFEIGNSRVEAVTIVGCGGTGGFVADSLARWLPRDKNLVLIDMDTVEEDNLNRQSFTTADIGLFKSEALAKRLAVKYQRPVQYSVLPAGAGDLPHGIIVGCVDNGPARQAIASRLRDGQWWVDSGNGHNFGQVLIGNSQTAKLHPSFVAGLCFRLPLPTIQQPAILAQVPRDRSCAEAVAADEQGPTINQAMAALVLEVVRRIIEGTCPWMQLLLDLDAGTLTPTMASPEVVFRLTGIRPSRLIEKEEKGRR